MLAQLGHSPDEEEQLLRLWTAGVSSVGQEQLATALAVCVGTGDLPSSSLVTDGVQEAGMGNLSRVDPGPADSAVAAGLGASAVGSESSADFFDAGKCFSSVLQPPAFVAAPANAGVLVHSDTSRGRSSYGSSTATTNAISSCSGTTNSISNCRSSCSGTNISDKGSASSGGSGR